MASKSLSRLSGPLLRRSLRPIRPQSPSCTSLLSRAPSSSSSARIQTTPVLGARSFQSSSIVRGILPDAEDPPPRQAEESERPKVPTDISTSEYNKLADEFFDDLVARLEAEQDKRTDLEIEYAAGVLEVSLQSTGTYVLNKQPPNKQIWLSSPLSGPKRFDWVVTGEGLNQKEGAGQGDWVYLRDGDKLTELVRKELGVKLGADEDVPQ